MSVAVQTSRNMGNGDMERERFLEGMSKAANTVSVVTTDGRAGRAGVTVSALCSVSADPPSLLVCVHYLSPACAAIRDNGTFCVNLLGADQAAISETFAGRRPAPHGDRFACAEWYPMANGSPAMSDALVAFDCSVMQAMRCGSHYVFIGQVVDVELAGARATTPLPLVHANRSYGAPHPLAVPSA